MAGGCWGEVTANAHRRLFGAVEVVSRAGVVILCDSMNIAEVSQVIQSYT